MSDNQDRDLPTLKISNLSQQQIITAALECARQQREILCSSERLVSDEIHTLQELERVRSKLIQRIDWPAVSSTETELHLLRELYALNEINARRISTYQKIIVDEAKKLKARRLVVAQYTTNQ